MASGLPSVTSGRAGGRIRPSAAGWPSIASAVSIGSFHDQQHQLGPVLKFDLTDKIEGMAGLLFGLTDRTAEREFRLFVTYAL